MAARKSQTFAEMVYELTKDLDPKELAAFDRELSKRIPGVIWEARQTIKNFQEEEMSENEDLDVFDSYDLPRTQENVNRVIHWIGAGKTLEQAAAMVAKEKQVGEAYRKGEPSAVDKITLGLPQARREVHRKDPVTPLEKISQHFEETRHER